MEFNLDDFVRAIHAVTTVYRKGEVVERRGIVTEVFGYEHTDNADGAEQIVDLVFVDIGVKPEARERSEAFMFYLSEWHSPTLPDGPSYIHTGAELGDQETALRLFAIGHVLGFWKVTTPASLGFEGDEVRAMAGQGLLYAIPTPDFRKAVTSAASPSEQTTAVSDVPLGAALDTRTATHSDQTEHHAPP